MDFIRKPIFFLLPLIIAFFVVIHFARTQFGRIQGFVFANNAMEDEMVRVASVIDGDTIELTDGRRVRYIGIDAPDKKECFYKEATVENKRLVEGKAVRLHKDISNVDPYKRILRYVYVDDTFVNDLLVAGGFASAWDVPPDEENKEILFASQKLAKDGDLGLWKTCR